MYAALDISSGFVTAMLYLDITVTQHVLDEQDGPQFQSIDTATGDDEQVGEAADTDCSVEARPGVLEGRVDPKSPARQETADLRGDVGVTR